MSDIFPRLNINLNNAAGVLAPAAVRSIEAIKQDVIAQLSRLPPGAALNAEVIAQLDDGTFIANVANIPLRLALPLHAKIGDKLKLTISQTNPHLTFSVDGKPTTAIFETTNQTASGLNTKPITSLAPHLNNQILEPKQNQVPSNTASESKLDTRAPQSLNRDLQVNLGGRFKDALQTYQAVSTQYDSSAQIDISPTGKILAAVLGETSRPGIKLAIAGTIPLADDITAKANPSRLAQRIETQLTKQIEHSGLFYESHLRQWAQGEREIAELQQEPQSRLSLALENTVLTDTHEENHAALTQLVHQQLDVLDQGCFTWVGKLTESVNFQMHVELEQASEDETGSAQNEQDRPKLQTWRTKLTLQFPKLGEVELSIALREHASDVQCRVASPEIVQTLHEHAKELIKAFDNSGHQLHSMKVTSK